MKREQLADKNLDLFQEFIMYSLENPEILDRIPKGATLIILPEDDTQLFQKNMEIVQKSKEEGQKVVTVKMRTPKRIIPQLEIPVV